MLLQLPFLILAQFPVQPGTQHDIIFRTIPQAAHLRSLSSDEDFPKRFPFSVRIAARWALAR